MNGLELKISHDDDSILFPLGKRLSLVGGKKRALLTSSYSFAHLSSLDGLDGLWDAISEREYSLKSMLIESLFNGDWGYADDEKKEIARSIRDGSLDDAVSNWSHLLPEEEQKEASRLINLDLLSFASSLEEKDIRKNTAKTINAISERLVGNSFGDDWRLEAGPFGDEGDENAYAHFEAKDGDVSGRLALAPALLYFGPKAMSDAEKSRGEEFISLEMRTMSYKKAKSTLLSEFYGTRSAEALELRNALGAVKALTSGSADWDAAHARFRYYNKKGRKGDFLGLPMAEKKFTTLLSVFNSFSFEGNEVWLFEDAETGLDKKCRDALARVIAAISESLEWKVIVSTDDDYFGEAIKAKAAKATLIDVADEVTVDGRRVEYESAEGEVEEAHTQPSTFFELSTGIDMEPYFTASFNGVCFYLNKFTSIVEDKSAMESPAVLEALENSYRDASAILNGKLAPSSVDEWQGSAEKYAKSWRVSSVEADIRERRTNRYIEISGIEKGSFGFSPKKDGEDMKPWLIEKMDRLTHSVYTLALALEENGVRFNQNTMVYKSLDALLYYLSDAYYITERGKVHRHIMKDVKEKIDYLYTYYGLKKVLKKFQD